MTPRPLISLAFLLLTFQIGRSQTGRIDSLPDGPVVTLSDVVVRSGTDVRGFIERVKADTTFYKAFRNLRVLRFTSLNDIRMLDRSGAVKASLYSRTRQEVSRGCRHTEKISEEVSGDFYEANGSYRYYTASLYAGLFFAFDSVCGETNIVRGVERSIEGKSGLDKHKEQLKMLFFNPGARIPGIPLMGNKVALFDPSNAKLYDFSIDMEDYKGRTCYLFTVKARDDLSAAERDQVVIDGMTTRFDYRTFNVLSRQYRMSYDAGVYHFQVQMEVELEPWKQYLLPRVIRYTGDWGVLFRKKEDAVFTATLFDFDEGR
jgi:hypothetical protein